MFRPCIDLHEGQVKQIVGGTLGGEPDRLRTNFVSDHPAAWYAELYKRDGLKGGHVIMLGPGNEEAARAALRVYPGGLQVGGGITVETAGEWLEAGASHVIVTSWAFREGRVDWDRLTKLVQLVGKEQLVLDLSCRRRQNDYFVVTDRWQKFTDLTVSRRNLENSPLTARNSWFTRQMSKDFVVASMSNSSPGWLSGRQFPRPTPAVPDRLPIWKR